MATSNSMEVNSENRRRYLATSDFIALSAETGQPYRVIQYSDVWAVPPDDEDSHVSIYFDATQELLVEQSVFLSHTKRYD